MKADAVLFAAGRGERMRPLTDVIPKPAVPLLDVPVAAFALEALRRAGRVPLVNLSHLASTGRRLLEPHAPGALWLTEPHEPYGTAGTLREAGRMGLLSTPVLTWNADVVAGVDPAALVAAHVGDGAPVTAVVEEVNRGADFLVEGGRAVGFVDRRQRASAAGARFAGIAVMSAEVFSLIPAEGPAGLGETVLAALAQRGEIALVAAPGEIIDVGTVSAFRRASLAVLGHPRGPSPPGRKVEAEGGVAYLGPGAAAIPGSVGPEAVVLAGAGVEIGARVERAVIWPRERVPRGVEVTDCVWFGGRALEG